MGREAIEASRKRTKLSTISTQRIDWFVSWRALLNSPHRLPFGAGTLRQFLCHITRPLKDRMIGPFSLTFSYSGFTRVY